MAYTFTLEAPALELELKKLIVQETEKDEFDPAEISDDEWLFGEQSRIQLDSLDALQVEQYRLILVCVYRVIAWCVNI